MKNNIRNNKIFGSIASLGSATLLNALLTFLVGISTRNILGPEQYGYWMTVSIILTFIPLFQLGTLNAMNREVPFFIARNENKKVEEIKELVFSFIFTIPLLLVLILICSSILLLFTDIHFEYKIGVALVSIIALLTYLSAYAETYYKSEQNFSRASKLISVKSISQSIITLGLVYTIGYIGLYLGILISLVIEIFIARKIFPKINKKHDFSKYKHLIKIGFPILLVGLVWSIVIATDRMIIALFMTPRDLGNYGIGMLVFNTVMLFPQVIGQVFYPKIVGFVSKGNYLEIKRYFWKVNKILGVVMLAAITVGYFLLPTFIKFFLPEYIEGIDAAQILLIGIYPLSLVGLAANYFNSTNNQKVYLVIQLVCIIINIILSIVFLKFVNNSITSIALSTSISFTVYSILMNIFFWLKIKKESIKFD